MQFLFRMLTFAVFALALPSAEKQDSSGSQQIGKGGALVTAGQCKIGQRYCFGAIVGDLNVTKQDILHQYCNQKYKNDWQSCNRCKRPWAMPECWDGPGAWASVFECKGPEVYKWVERCEGSGSICSGGTCRWTRAEGLAE
ncbi:uncharacterized protein EKO05_0005859 [Ascochyta rabiei]|uniref:Uncharacterized protein n=1 Tax=Didymella rabiei TaxID=5454 RepID=A0A163IZ39_DIDRA|nr:uncharacterized protein EKO05_0005859 [Ascochyta rabiei]KZM26038.1 hypothetical protein ST47_g2801 [Ascochyta rabiei]UPX15412.1 hypothetical protein EKO05_0005859 [Ascochyta rabiei]